MRKIFGIVLFISVLVLPFSCNEDDAASGPVALPPENDFREFESTAELENTLKELTEDEEVTRLVNLMDSLEINGLLPFVNQDTVLFIYYGNANSVNWAGDFNGWNASDNQFSGENLNESDVWILRKTFPIDARLDYKIVLDGSNWILDPRNPHQQVGGYGPNSELRMPNWIFPVETVVVSGTQRGILSDNILISSSPSNLGYDINYKVYTPVNYDALDNLPVLYVTDGHEYADETMGATVNVLDNLISDNKIKPLIAVFIDPREPSNPGNNRRSDEYRANIKFANFVADELVTKIDSDYKTDTNPESRAIMGTSLGGWNSAYFGLVRNDVFGKLIIHSPAFDAQIINDYETASKMPLDIFMSTGVIYDTEVPARAMRDVMLNKGYNLNYVEVNEGHSWGNWRALIDEPLLQHFPN